MMGADSPPLLLPNSKLPNKIYIEDNLVVLRGIEDESVDLIYLDPPFNTKRIFSAPIGSKAAGASFKDMWTWDDVDKYGLYGLTKQYPHLVQFLESIEGLHGKPMMSYCYFMFQRIVEMHRVLKPTGSIYLHCDPTASHYLKLVLDSVFGEKNFRNEIVWKRKDTIHNRSTKKFGANADNILFYAKSQDAVFNKQFTPYSQAYIDSHYKHDDEDGRGRYRKLPLTNESGGNRPYEFRGVTRAWRWSHEKMEEAYLDNRLWQASPTSPWQYKKYLKDAEGVPCQTIWLDIDPVSGKEATGYPTQKPLSLLKRVIEASSNKGDVVLDPFCGCATACIAAEELGRKWVGIDISEKAGELVMDRLRKMGLIHNLPAITNIVPTLENPMSKGKAKPILYAEQKGRCNHCGESEALDKRAYWHVDHIVPKKRGGQDQMSNYQLLCMGCNNRKSSMPDEWARAELRRVRELVARNTFSRAG